MALGDDFERREFSSIAVATTLSGAMGGTGAVTPSITDATGWPDGSDGPFYVLFNGSEICLVSSRVTTTLTIASGGRGQLGTSAANHASGTSVVFVGTGRDLDEANRIVNILGNGTSGLPLLGGGSATVPAFAKVDSGGIADGAIDLVHMSANSVDSDQYVDGSIDGAHIANDAVDSAHIAAGAIDLEHMSADSVDSAQYVDGSIDREHLSADIIDGSKIEDDAVDSEHIAAGAIDNAHLADGDTVTVAETADAVMGKWLFFSRTGTLVTGTGTVPMPVLENVTILGVRAHVGTAPTGASIKVDVNKNGTTIFTDQDDRPEIAISGTESSTETPAVTTADAGDEFKCDIDQVGSTVAGADLTVAILVVPR